MTIKHPTHYLGFYTVPRFTLPLGLLQFYCFTTLNHIGFIKLFFFFFYCFADVKVSCLNFFSNIVENCKTPNVIAPHLKVSHAAIITLWLTDRTLMGKESLKLFCFNIIITVFSLTISTSCINPLWLKVEKQNFKSKLVNVFSRHSTTIC